MNGYSINNILLKKKDLPNTNVKKYCGRPTYEIR